MTKTIKKIIISGAVVGSIVFGVAMIKPEPIKDIKPVSKITDMRNAYKKIRDWNDTVQQVRKMKRVAKFSFRGGIDERIKVLKTKIQLWKLQIK